MAEEQADPDREAWAGARVDRWVAMADRLDRQLAPITELLIEATGLRPGDRVLDVGCGTGPIARGSTASTRSILSAIIAA